MYYSKTKSGYVLRLEVGEELQESLRQFVQKEGLEGGFYQGIGMLHQVELAFFLREEKEYHRQFFDGDFELVSLLGNISSVEEEALPHSHVVLSNQKFETVSGHLVRGTVCVTAEIFLVPSDISLGREEDPILRFMRLSMPHCSHLSII